ncbi:ParB N-terminal domain-containing protein [Chakrabartyella piscis]|uniref:ParB N-terminal domain-containing protein n=1 Tax=Chakrabartyella piscis TaxID=2918914 RepID=UPI0029583D14|nr:ParB N-terminal domain-containing protein [Chakrabartyella piscis]
MALKKPPIQLESFIDMFPDKQEPETVTTSGITEMAFSKMQSFPNHKYKLYEGQRLQDMVDSIKEFGIITPIILWHNENGEYIILSGHNRKNAGELAGLDKAPVVIKTDLTLEEARLIVNETNLRQRSFTDLSHSERAYCLSEHYSAMKSQGRRNDLLKEIEILLNPDDSKENSTSAEVQQKLESRDKLGQDYGLSKDKVECQHFFGQFL